MANFFRGLGNDLEHAAGYVGGLIHEGLEDVESMGKSAAHFIDSAKDEAFSTANHVISGGEDLGKDVLATGKGIVDKTESIISIPLILLAGGLALFMLSGNAKVAIQEGSRVAQQGMKNPELFM